MTSELVRQAAWGEHGYGLPARGSEKSIEQLRTDRLKDLFTETCNPRNAIITVTGDVEVQQVRDFLDLYMDQWADASDLFPAGAQAYFSSEFVDSLPPIESGAVQEVHRVSPVAAVQLGFAAPSTRDPRFPTYQLLSAWLGGTEGRFRSRLREESVPAYRVAVEDHDGALGSLLGVYAACAPNEITSTEADLVNALQEAARAKPSPEEMRSVALRLTTDILLHHQTLADRNALLARREAFGMAPEEPEDQVHQYETITVQEVEALARQMLLDVPYATGRVQGTVEEEHE
jgi:predicted Zn-dependent peptidase